MFDLPYEIEWTKKALRQLTELDKPLARRIAEKIEETKETPHHLLEKLVGREEWKLRIGDYRALLMFDEEKKRLVVLKVGHRKNVYKK